MKRLATALAILSWLLFLASLWLPAANLGAWGVVLGWEAAWGAIGSVESMFTDRDAPALFVHGLTNALLLGGPLVVISRRQGRWRWLAHVTLVATLYNLRAGWALDTAVGSGFYVWLAAFVAATVSLYLGIQSSGGNRTKSSNYGVQLTVDAPSKGAAKPTGRLRAPRLYSTL